MSAEMDGLRVVTLTTELLDGASPDERAAVLGGVARRVYGLPA